MKSKIILHIEGDEEAIKNVYFEITNGHSMEATYGEYKKNKLIEIHAKVYKTELKEETK